MRLLGIVHAHNEAVIIERVIMMLLDSGHHVHVFDHRSNDGTRDLVRSIPRVAYHPVSMGFPGLFNYIARFINRKPHDWVTWMDADELLRDPDGNMVTRKAIKREWKAGTGVIRPLVREFWLTDADDPEEPDHVLRLRHFRYRKSLQAPRSWARRYTGSSFRQGRHRGPKGWPGKPRISSNQWLLDHYPVRTEEQGRQKIMSRRWAKRGYYRRYRAAGCKNLVEAAGRMHCVDGGD